MLRPLRNRGDGSALSRIVVMHFAWAAALVGLLVVAQRLAPSVGELDSYALLYAPFTWALIGLASLPINVAAAVIARRLIADGRISRWTPAMIATAAWLVVGFPWLASGLGEQPAVQLRTAVVFAIAAPGFGALVALTTPRR